ncbi:hypothetical protein [Chelatococcus sp. YT9]|uniref:hypothetical protein n=1 Tax=Chelatococcus sp. YT9 TaxID=2835635 RepID=UPI001BCBF796|nr:hypothetical protein [Chelatococcus sp. YT9]MBS7698587.1 hypothetical protein [Chelatococcus sp. YT9]
MSAIPDDLAREVADLIDAYDQQIDDANSGKRDAFQRIREALETSGLRKAEIAIEMAAFKDAIKERRVRRQDPEKADALDQREASAAEYLDVIQSRTRSARHAREERQRRRTSESMADHKEFSAELAAAGLISPQAHAENVQIADAVAARYGNGPKNTPQPAQPPSVQDEAEGNQGLDQAAQKAESVHSLSAGAAQAGSKKPDPSNFVTDTGEGEEALASVDPAPVPDATKPVQPLEDDPWLRKRFPEKYQEATP